MKSKSKAEVNDEKFVEAWVSAYRRRTGLPALAKKLNMEPVKASQRASMLRNIGVKLPTMPKKQQKTMSLEINVKKLNEIVVNKLGEEAMTWRTR